MDTPLAPLSYVQPVGVILNATLALAPELPNYPAAVALDFTPSFPISPGDSITVALTDFALPGGEQRFSADCARCHGRAAIAQFLDAPPQRLCRVNPVADAIDRIEVEGRHPGAVEAGQVGARMIPSRIRC